ncbi:MAG: hypothetical protein H6828_09855 [Planctomycetes bacterium]|nr:hypothetical protein [Planctomycetota bacterium]
MSIFCRLYGHTWIHDVESPKIRWNTDKDQVELHATVEGEPRFFERCVRCGERRPWRAKGGERPAQA